MCTGTPRPEPWRFSLLTAEPAYGRGAWMSWQVSKMQSVRQLTVPPGQPYFIMLYRACRATRPRRFFAAGVDVAGPLMGPYEIEKRGVKIQRPAAVRRTAPSRMHS